MKIDIENYAEVVAWLNDLKKGFGDARPLWLAMKPKIIEFVDQQFDPASDKTKLWKKLASKYKQWKAKQGYPTAIGIRKGVLKHYTGAGARVQLRPDRLIWAVDSAKVFEDQATKKGKNRRVYYAGYFDSKRPIFRNIFLRVNSFLSFDISTFNDGNYNSFTYKWLRNTINKQIAK